MFRKILFMLFILSFIKQPFIFGEAIGKIEKMTGDVKIDAFGKDSFIDALNGDILYINTVLYFPAGSDAIVLIRDKRLKIISTSLDSLEVRYEENHSILFSHNYIVIGDLFILIPEKRKKPDHFLIPIWEMLNEITSNLFNNINVRKYSTRELTPEKDVIWVTDMDFDVLIIAWGQFKDENYESALATLMGIEEPDDLSLPGGGVEFLRGVCYLKLQDYEQAKEQFTISEQNIRLYEVDYYLFYFYHPLLYLIGTLSYFSADYTNAITYFMLYLECTEMDNVEISISACSLFTEACIRTGCHEKAGEFLKKVIAGCTNDPLKKKLKILLTDLYSYEANF